ncbi:hypothetical protein [Erwinia rhapontici]|uniref:WYL domain-containing protein n=1 Tax=Erwinia rhapontici TaxID=55212 RepID=UPI0018658B6F|nr:hypothetical protein [Erwinia rhapontici]MBP2156192.1 putative DNA-binding transcriptional regulator YafY [Erwinia rhapontici]
MDIIISLISLGLVVWAVRRICSKKQSSGKKFGKSILAILYFLMSGGIAIDKTGDPLIAIFLILIGAAAVSYSNRNYKEPKNGNTAIFGEHAAALKDFDLAGKDKKPNVYRTTNYVKSKDAELTEIAFNYVNGSGETSFRDVDVKKFDGQYIEGYCHLSRAFKTFRLDRVDGDVILRGTGEAMDAYHWAGEMEGQ